MYRNQTEIFSDSLQLVTYAKLKSLLTLQELVDYVTNATFKTAINTHITETKAQLNNLYTFFDAEGLSARHESQGIDHLLRDCRNKLVQSTGDNTARNLIVAETVLKLEFLELGMIIDLQPISTALGFATLRTNINTAETQDRAAATAARNVVYTINGLALPLTALGFEDGSDPVAAAEEDSSSEVDNNE